MYDVMKWTAH